MEPRLLSLAVLLLIGGALRSANPADFTNSAGTANSIGMANSVGASNSACFAPFW